MSQERQFHEERERESCSRPSSNPWSKAIYLRAVKQSKIRRKQEMSAVIGKGLLRRVQRKPRRNPQINFNLFLLCALPEVALLWKGSPAEISRGSRSHFFFYFKVAGKWYSHNSTARHSVTCCCLTLTLLYFVHCVMTLKYLFPPVVKYIKCLLHSILTLKYFICPCD